MRRQQQFIYYACAAHVCGLFACNEAQCAESYPVKPLRMVIPHTPGGPPDLVGRALAAKLQEALGQQVIVDNRSGGGVIATEIVAHAPADGYTLLRGTPGQLVTLPLLTPKLPYDVVRDFAPVTQAVDSPQVRMANARPPAVSVPEMIAYARTRPGQLDYASVQPHVAARLHAELVTILAAREIQQQLAQFGVEPISNTPRQIAAYMRVETERWGKVIRASGIRLD